MTVAGAHDSAFSGLGAVCPCVNWEQWWSTATAAHRDNSTSPATPPHHSTHTLNFMDKFGNCVEITCPSRGCEWRIVTDHPRPWQGHHRDTGRSGGTSAYFVRFCHYTEINQQPSSVLSTAPLPCCGLEEWLRNCWQILCQESVMMNSELLSAMTSNQWFCYTSYKWIGIGWIWIMDLCSFWCRGGQIYCTLHQKTIKHSSFGRSNNLFQAVEQEISQIANTQQRSNWWKHKIFAGPSLGLAWAYLQADDNVTATVAGPGAGQVVSGRHVGEVWLERTLFGHL